MSAWLTDDELDQALCRQVDPELWWPEGKGDTRARRAIKVCQRCPIMLRCAEVAIANGEREGVWGAINLGNAHRHPERVAS